MYGFTFKPIIFLMSDFGGGGDGYGSDNSWGGGGFGDISGDANNQGGSYEGGFSGSGSEYTGGMGDGSGWAAGGQTEGFGPAGSTPTDNSGGGGGGGGTGTTAAPASAPAPFIPATAARYVKWENGRPAYIYYLDAAGKEVIEKDYSEINRMMDEAKAKQYPDFNTYLSERGIQLNQFDLRGLESLISEINKGPDLAGAEEYSANQLGYGSDAERDAAMAAMNQQRSLGIEGQRGMSDEELASRRATNRQFYKEKERMALMSLDSIASSGQSFANYAMKSDQFTNSLLNQKLAAEDNLAKEAYERKKGEYAALDARYLNAFQAGQVSAQQYLNAKQASIESALKAYATQADIMLKNNEQYLRQYDSDMNTITRSIQTMYTAITMEMGVDSQAIEQANLIWQQEMAPQFAEWQRQASERNANAQSAAATASGINGAVSLITGALTAIGLLAGL